MRILIVAVGLALLAGCATYITPLEHAKPVSNDKLYWYQSGLSGPSGKLTVVRDSGVPGSACDVDVYIQGRKSATIQPGELASFYLPVGHQNLAIALAKAGLCSGTVQSISVIVQNGQESMYRVSGDIDGTHIGPYIDYK